jgi:condensin complex subunit 3
MDIQNLSGVTNGSLTANASCVGFDCSITQRAMTIERGLAERVPAVREECEKLLESWLSKDCDDDPLILLRYLDVETHEKVGETVMLELLEKGKVRFSEMGLRRFLDTPDSQQQVMSAEEALFWRVVCGHAHKEAKTKGCEAASTGGAEAAVNAAMASEQNEYLESILPPTVADFVRLVEAHLHKGISTMLVQYKFE